MVLDCPAKGDDYKNHDSDYGEDAEAKEPSVASILSPFTLQRRAYGLQRIEPRTQRELWSRWSKLRGCRNLRWSDNSPAGKVWKVALVATLICID